MFEITKKSMQWGGRDLTIETGKIARQADGAVVVTYGETQVLATVVGVKENDGSNDFFPLTVHYIEKFYAAGKIPGGYLKREGRPSDKETLTSRLIDRPIRPLFPENFKNEVQVICQVINYDKENNADIPAIIAASAALTISGIPFLGPIASTRVAKIDDEFILNPTNEQVEGSDLDLVVAGTKKGVLMVESEANELSEDTMLEAVEFGKKSYMEVLDLIISLAKETAKEPWDLNNIDLSKEIELVEKTLIKDIENAYKIKEKTSRTLALKKISTSLDVLAEKNSLDINLLKQAYYKFQKNFVRSKLFETKKRIDGRNVDEVRSIDCETAILSRSHGSALFTRGETQALVSLTLGTSDDEQMVDSLDGMHKERFMLHYNFPPFSVGEAGRMGGTGRREIGHGKLAWRALNPILPKAEDFPYTFRLVSEITESNGSSSMATVCGSSLALMNAGVPIKKQVAGIAMGLIKEDDKFIVLSDILGDEDHLGDMDFKVAGTKDGITSLQMDIKIDSITKKIMSDALKQAKKGRATLLKVMDKEINKPNETMNRYAPKMITMNVKKDKIREVIGSGGKVIREIVEISGAKVDIDDTGVIKIASSEQENIDKAKQLIHDIIDEAEEGKIYKGKVVKIMDFGAFVNFLGKKDGLVHISALSDNRVEKVTDIVNEGDEVTVKVIGFDRRGKVKLSMKDVDQKTGKEI
ncbi:MAG: polyribonucleotide nucleotidyltransferase [Rickettsiales bacterium]|nr:polyribonucleotide nucleotidyltransferase [Rickettsiales bacterium]OUV76944.1 MAG: polyribonucleotide nucleotidyltransferase [Rickettsiales bacterium TMED131]